MQTIKTFDESTEFPLKEERCHIVEIHNDEDDPDCSISRARVEPGFTTALHKLKGVFERYVIISGKGEVKIGDDDPAVVGHLDVVNIPADTPQQITNTGQEDLVFLCVCAPRFNKECYIDLECNLKGVK
jgi:mannose-6-phosphate isomerase-like protein (cupin superfamily)